MTLKSSAQSSLDIDVLQSWRRFHAHDSAAVLATLVRKTGSSPRPLGSQIAISKDGDAVGYITGGCAEAALVAEAVAALAAGENRIVRLGEGSRYADVKLPCGAGIDVAFSTDVDPAFIERALQALRARQATTLSFDLRTGGFVAHSQQTDDLFVRPYSPTLLIDIVGKGPVVPALAKIAIAARFDVRVASPEP